MKTRKRRDEGSSGGLRNHPNLFGLYYECIENARELLEEGRILFDAERFARAFALAFTAYEEIGKSQVVADAYYDLVSMSELTDAFTRHDLKVAYVRRVVKLKLSPDEVFPQATIDYNRIDAKTLIEQRIRALYVDIGVDYAAVRPSDAINSQIAEEMLRVVEDELDAIAYAEELNGLIGTRGLWK